METVVAIDAIVPIVNPKNPVKNLTIDQLSQIYQGKITNWKEVGGDNLEIVVISRDSSSGTFEAWGELVLNKAKVTPRAQLQASNGAIVQAVSKNKYALGYIGLGYLDKSVKALTVNGVSRPPRRRRSPRNIRFPGCCTCTRTENRRGRRRNSSSSS